MELAIWLIVGLIAGGAIGAVATWWISRARGGVVSVMQLKQENDKFRDEVAEHFVETARLINQMSESYKQVFDHLSSGAEKLVDDEKLAERLPPATGQEVRLSQFGASGSGGSAGEKSGKSGSGAAANDSQPDSRSNDSPSRQSEDDAGKDATKNGGNASDGKDSLKSGSDQTAAKASRPAAADSKSDSESGNDDKTGSGETGESLKADNSEGKGAGSAGKGASASNQAGEGSRSRD